MPAIVAMCLAGWFAVSQPGEIRKDAFEYDSIARNLVAGRGYAYQDQLTMNREPGYPVFRAVVYVLHGNEKTILWLQVLLVGGMVLLVGDAFRKLTGNKEATAAAWGAALAYGYSIYAASHYSEAFTGFIVALVGWLATRCMTEKRTVSAYGALIVASAILVLTRMNMAFIPPALFFTIAMAESSLWKRRVQVLVLLGVAWVALLLPWVIRNGIQFHEWAISGRSGIQFYARMVKAREPISRLGASLVSVVGSHVGSSALGLRPIIVDDQWIATWNRFNELSATSHLPPANMDRALRHEALAAITSSPRMLFGYLAWTPVEALRLWALPSPGSPNFSIENTFYPAWQTGHFTALKAIILAIADILQILFWTAFIYMLYLGWKQYKWRWVPGWMILAVTLAHLSFDAIIRYGVPVQPWVWAMIAWGLMSHRTKLTNLFRL